MNSVKRSKYDRRVLLRLTEFILPPPHPSVKEMYPRGAISYDQITTDANSQVENLNGSFLHGK